MKWSFLVVVMLGLVAALCVGGLMFLLPAYFRGTSGRPTVVAEVGLVVAAKPLAAMQIIDAGSVTIKKVPKKSAPENCFSDPVQVIGKVAILSMVEGQPFTKNCFASDGSGAQLAAAIPKGMRAVAVALADHSGLFGVLYPGSRVDVMVSYGAAGGARPGAMAAAKTLLQNVQVLGIEQQTIVSSESEKPGNSNSSRKRTVTLMVAPDQASILESAMEGGTVSLAMRNPLDATVARNTEPVAPRIERPTTRPSQTWEMTILKEGKAQVRTFSMVPAAGSSRFALFPWKTD